MFSVALNASIANNTSSILEKLTIASKLEETKNSPEFAGKNQKLINCIDNLFTAYPDVRNAKLEDYLAQGLVKDLIGRKDASNILGATPSLESVEEVTLKDKVIKFCVGREISLEILADLFDPKHQLSISSQKKLKALMLELAPSSTRETRGKTVACLMRMVATEPSWANSDNLNLINTLSQQGITPEAKEEAVLYLKIAGNAGRIDQEGVDVLLANLGGELPSFSTQTKDKGLVILSKTLTSMIGEIHYPALFSLLVLQL